MGKGEIVVSGRNNTKRKIKSGGSRSDSRHLAPWSTQCRPVGRNRVPTLGKRGGYLLRSRKEAHPIGRLERDVGGGLGSEGFLLFLELLAWRFYRDTETDLGTLLYRDSRQNYTLSSRSLKGMWNSQFPTTRKG